MGHLVFVCWRLAVVVPVSFFFWVCAVCCWLVFVLNIFHGRGVPGRLGRLPISTRGHPLQSDKPVIGKLNQALFAEAPTLVRAGSLVKLYNHEAWVCP